MLLVTVCLFSRIFFGLFLESLNHVLDQSLDLREGISSARPDSSIHPHRQLSKSWEVLLLRQFTQETNHFKPSGLRLLLQERDLVKSIRKICRTCCRLLNRLFLLWQLRSTPRPCFSSLLRSLELWSGIHGATQTARQHPHPNFLL